MHLGHGVNVPVAFAPAALPDRDVEVRFAYTYKVLGRQMPGRGEGCWMRRVVVLGLVATVALAACGSDDSDSKASSDGGGAKVVAVKLVDTGCGKPTYTAKAGKLTFNADNITKRDAEFEILAPGPSIVAEKDPIEAGKTRDADREPAAGEYELRCTLGSDATTSTLTVTGKGGVATLKVDQAALDDAVAQYRNYIVEQTDLLQQRRRTFAAAVEAGNVEQAKALYAHGRIPWETIEPVAELFPDVDGAIDSRVDDHEVRTTRSGPAGTASRRRSGRTTAPRAWRRSRSSSSPTRTTWSPR